MKKIYFVITILCVCIWCIACSEKQISSTDIETMESYGYRLLVSRTFDRSWYKYQEYFDEEKSEYRIYFKNAIGKGMVVIYSIPLEEPITSKMEEWSIEK